MYGVTHVPHATRTLGDVAHDVVDVPLIAHVEGAVEEVVLLGLGQHEDVGLRAV